MIDADQFGVASAHTDHVVGRLAGASTHFDPSMAGRPPAQGKADSRDDPRAHLPCEDAFRMLEELKTRAIALATTRTGRAGGARGASAAEDLELAAALGSYFDQAESIVSRQIAQLDACVRSVYGRRDPSQRATYEDNFERLSTTERRILVELAKGKPNKILAYEFSVREATIKAHVSNILKKLNASNRGHAIALVARCR